MEATHLDRSTLWSAMRRLADAHPDRWSFAVPADVSVAPSRPKGRDLGADDVQRLLDAPERSAPSADGAGAPRGTSDRATGFW